MTHFTAFCKELAMRAKLSETNPSPFKQPFLCLEIAGRNGTNRYWCVDVDGQMQKYTSPLGRKPTKLLLELCEMLASNGFQVVHYGKYIGSAGPSYILRHGAFFKRMSKDLEKEGSPRRAKKFVPPTWRQHW